MLGDDVLKGIDSLLHADLLYLLAAMGHGDELAIVDRNFPAASRSQRLVRLDGADLLAAGRAILSVFPVDDFVPEPVTGMRVVDGPLGGSGDGSGESPPRASTDETPQVQLDFLRLVEESEGRQVTMASVSRHDFYARASAAFGVVVTSEARAYGCVLLTKGVIRGPADAQSD
jgi:L-fucose mutarotase